MRKAYQNKQNITHLFKLYHKLLYIYRNMILVIGEDCWLNLIGLISRNNLCFIFIIHKLKNNYNQRLVFVIKR